MKVLTLGRLPHAEVGGLPMYTANLGAALVECGVDLTVVHPGSPAPPGRYPFAVREPGAVAWPGAGRVRSFRQAFAVAREARAALREVAPDVVHLQYGGAMDLALLRGVAGRGVPVVVTAHCGRAWAHLARTPGLAARTLARADRVLAISRDQCELFGNAGLPLDRLAQIGSLVEEDFFAPLTTGPTERGAGERPRAVYLGRIAPEKGLDLVVDALAALTPGERPDFAATGPVSAEYAAELEARAVAAGVADRFRLLAPVSTTAERMAVLDGADFVIHPTRSDVKPLVVIEALARGLPVIASNLPGTVELLSGEGQSFSVGDVAGLVDELRGLLGAGLHRRLAARDVAEVYHPHAAAEETLRHLHAVAEAPATRLRRAS